LITSFGFKLHCIFTISWFCELWTFMTSMYYCYYRIIWKFCWIEAILDSTTLHVFTKSLKFANLSFQFFDFGHHCLWGKNFIKCWCPSILLSSKIHNFLTFTLSKFDFKFTLVVWRLNFVWTIWVELSLNLIVFF